MQRPTEVGGGGLGKLRSGSGATGLPFLFLTTYGIRLMKRLGFWKEPAWISGVPGLSLAGAVLLLCDPRQQARRLVSLGLSVTICKWDDMAFSLPTSRGRGGD